MHGNNKLLQLPLISSVQTKAKARPDPGFCLVRIIHLSPCLQSSASNHSSLRSLARQRSGIHPHRPLLRPIIFSRLVYFSTPPFVSSSTSSTLCVTQPIDLLSLETTNLTLSSPPPPLGEVQRRGTVECCRVKCLVRRFGCHHRWATRRHRCRTMLLQL